MKKILYFLIALTVIAISCTVKKSEPTTYPTVNVGELLDSLELDSIQADTIIVNE